MSAVSAVPTRERYSPDWMLTNYDRETTYDPDLDTELKRLTVLRTFPVLRPSAQTDPDYEMLAELAMSLLETPMACIKLVDLSVIRVVASAGSWPKHIQEIPRKESFCAHTVQIRGGVLVVNDTLHDSRFQDLAHTIDGLPLRFYAGAPLISSEGAKIGSVCVFDTQPRPDGLTQQQYDHLLELSRLVVDMMEQSRKEEIESNKHVGFVKQARSKSISNHSESTSSTASLRGKGHASTGSLSSHHPSNSKEPVALSSFIRGIKMAMASFPKRVEMQFYMDPSCPLEFRVSNELAVFRSAVAMLTSACERTESGYIRLTVKTIKKGQLAFFCEDTGPNLDPGTDIFALDQESSETEGESCFRLDPQTGEVISGAVCLPTIETANGYSLHAVSEYMSELDGQYGYEPRSTSDDGATGSIVWFSFPTDDF